MSPPRHRPTALLIALDGVLRHYDPAVLAPAETRCGLPPGAVLETALRWPLLQPAITGRVTRAQWLSAVAEELAPRAGGAAAARALVSEWDAYRGAVVPEVLAFVRSTRRAGVPVGLATNGTDTLDAELAALGLTDEFDAVVSSARIGVHKPAPEFFVAACAAVDTPPTRCLFVDDTDRNIRGARAAGLSAHRYSGPTDLTYVRAALAP